VMVRFTTLMIAMHLLEILLWASFYKWHGLSSLATSFYFSASSYSTVGYSDVTFPDRGAAWPRLKASWA